METPSVEEEEQQEETKTDEITVVSDGSSQSLSQSTIEAEALEKLETKLEVIKESNVKTEIDREADGPQLPCDS